MPKIKLGNFSKRKNSTKQPVITTWTEYECSFKKPTSARNPVVELATNIHSYDYAYIDEFNRYYYVTDVVSLHNGLTQYVLACDAMASHKTEIGSTPARIAFSSTGYDILLPDQRVGVSLDKQITAVGTPTLFSTSGCYVLTTFNGDTSASIGLGTGYVMSYGDIQKVHQAMGNPTLWNGIKNFFTGTPLEAIFGCIWVPFSRSDAPSSSTSHVYVGDQDLSTQVTFSETGILNGTGLKKAGPFYLTIPRRYNDYRDYAPYSSAIMFLPGVGCVDINLADYVDATNICISVFMEYGTGDVTYVLTPDTENSQYTQTFTVNLASQCPLGQTTINGGGVLGSTSGIAAGLGSALMGAITENWGMVAAGAGAAILSGANVALNANKRGTSIKGGSGGRSASYYDDITLIVFASDTEDPTAASYIAQKGRPVCETHAISNHSGYVQCDDASVIMSGYDWERDEINGYLNSGFFYE